MGKIEPRDVHFTIRKYMLADGDEIVFDLKKSHGSYIYDSRYNRELLDFATCYASSPVGYNHPELLEPGFQEKLAYVAINKVTNSNFYTTEMAEFVDTFSRIAIPGYLPYLFLIEGGGPAVDNALKVAFDWKIRKEKGLGGWPRATQVIYFDQAFHGRTGYALSVTRTLDPRKTKYFPRFGWMRVQNPKARFPLNSANLREIEIAEGMSLSYINHTSTMYRIAAIIIEPIQGEGGDNHFRKEFLQALRKIADEIEALLIFDEIQTGVGLTGKMWAHEHFGVEPDIMIFGKKTQVCGVLCGQRIDEAENNVFHESSRINSTWGGNLVDMVRCQKYLEIIEEESLIDNAAKVGIYLLKYLQGLQDHYHIIDNARGRGLMAAFDLPSTDIRDKVIKVAYNKGLMILGCGEKSIRFRPPLNVSTDEIDKGIAILEESIIRGIRERWIE